VSFANYSATFHEDVLIKGGRMHIGSLSPGAVKKLTLPTPFYLPKGIPSKSFYVGVVADAGNSVKESNEKNNTTFIKWHLRLLATIERIREVGVMPSDTGNVELHIGGRGFGSTMGSKTVRMGSYTLRVEGSGSGWWAWEDNFIVAIVPADIPYGVYYNVYLKDNGRIISNSKRILLKIDLESCYKQVGNNYEDQGTAGSLLELHGTEFGSSQGDQRIRFGSLTVPANSWSNHRVTFTCPSLPPGSYQVWIERNGLDITLRRAYFQIIP
jgi:hypothetical protein